MNKELLDKATEFTKELLLLAEKHGVTEIGSCGCCGGVSVIFDRDIVTEFSISNTSGELEGCFTDTNWTDMTKVKIK